MGRGGFAPKWVQNYPFGAPKRAYGGDPKLGGVNSYWRKKVAVNLTAITCVQGAPFHSSTPGHSGE